MTDHNGSGGAPQRRPRRRLNAQPSQQQLTAEPRLGLSLARAKDMQGSGGKGVVRGVDPTSPAAQNAVQSGDVIFDAGGKAAQARHPTCVRPSTRHVRNASTRS